jgi:aspartyl protease family protein
MPDPHRRTGTFMLLIAWLLLFGVGYWFFSGWERRQVNPNTLEKLMAQQGEVVLDRNRDGHYVAQGMINGRPVTFLLDTGSTQVALSMELARELRLSRGHALRLATANGEVVGYQSRLDSVTLGTISVHDVAAAVTPGMSGNAVLLGMSFLKRMDFAQRGGKLVLRPARLTP